MEKHRPARLQKTAILQTSRLDQKRASVEAAVAGYYSSLSDVEVAEHAQWGEFALSQFPNNEEP